ncbi:MAG: glutaredoxin 3 [Xanthobacteraceae bacterium]
MPAIDIYTTRYCPYCRAAKELLDRKGAAYNEIDVGGDYALRETLIQRARGRTTVPQIFVGKVHVGGSDDLHALEHAGKLDPLLSGEGQPA